MRSRIKRGQGKFCSEACQHLAAAGRTIEERFWEKVQKSDGCWNWTAGTNGHGYGQLWSGGENGRLVQAHRVAWELHYGPIPEGMYVLHNCPNGDNRLCVNPAHLWLGTYADNSMDMVKKGRSPRAKLTEIEVRTIRHQAETGTSSVELANRFGVSYEQIRKIVNRKVWKHVQ